MPRPAPTGQAKVARALGGHLRGLALTACLLGALGCDKPLEPYECERLLDHYTERLVRDENPKAPAQVVAMKQREARTLARNEPVFEWARCANAVSRTQFDCAMSSVNVDDIEKCLTM